MKKIFLSVAGCLALALSSLALIIGVIYGGSIGTGLGVLSFLLLCLSGLLLA